MMPAPVLYLTVILCFGPAEAGKPCQVSREIVEPVPGGIVACMMQGQARVAHLRELGEVIRRWSCKPGQPA